MKLTNLNIDCLESILEYLELADLLNAADSNKRLCHASKFVYIKKYGSYRLYFVRAFKSKQKSVRHTNSPDPYISIMDENNIFCGYYLKCALQLLRNFGRFVYGIEFYMIFAEYDREAILCIIDYLNYFCHETLEYVAMLMNDKDTWNCFNKPFTSVKSVYFHSSVSTQRNSLVQLFPRMEKLTFSWADYEEIYESIVNHFPYLEYVNISSQYPELLLNITKERCTKYFNEFLKLNPQLKCLSMECAKKTEVEIIHAFDRCGLNPKRLELLDVDQFFKYFDGKVIKLRSVEHLSIKKYFKEKNMCEIPFLCSKLISFEIELDEQSNEHIYKFYRNHSTIRKLTLGYSAINEFNINYARLAQFLPLLEELTSYVGKLSADEAYHVLTLFKSLKYFRFVGFETFDFKKLEFYLNTEWSIQFERDTNNCITLKRNI